MLKFFDVFRHKNIHVTTLLKSIGIAIPILLSIFIAGISIDNLPLCFALFFAGGMCLYVTLINFIEDLKTNKEK